MIKINDTYSFDKDEYCWRLHIYQPPQMNPFTKVMGKKGSTTTTYHGSVLQVCKYVIDKDAGTATDLESLIACINKSTEECVVAVGLL